MRHLIIFVCLLAMASYCQATVIHVPTDQPTIQAGINAAVNGDTVLVSAGTYANAIDFSGKSIKVLSSEGAGVTILNPANVKCIAGESSYSELSGFTLIGSSANEQIFIDNGANPIISHNVFTGYTGSDINIRVESNALITYNLFYDNGGTSCIGTAGGTFTATNNTMDNNARGMHTVSGSGIAKNNIVTNSGEYGIYGTFTELDYNDVLNNNPNYQNGATPGSHDISTDPNYVDAAMNDYNLLSTSPCIDAGDPTMPVPPGGGDRIDIGAFEYNQHIPHTLIVPDSFATIQLAVDNAQTHDTILVRAGTYHENVRISEKDLVLLSEMGTDATFIQSDTSRCLTIRQSTVLVSGFRFTGITTVGQGGAISSDTSTLLVRDSRVEDSRVEYSYSEAKGGGIYAFATNIELKNCTISNNAASALYATGGGIFCAGRLRMDSCIIVGNRALTGGMQPNAYTGYGGGIYLLGDEAVVSHSNISDNSTYGSGFGGGLYLKGNSFLIDSCIFKANRLYAAHREGDTGGGGGLAVDGQGGSVVRCIIDSNLAWTGGNGAIISTGFGGGLYASGSVSIARNLISNNYLDVSGFYLRPDGIAYGGGAYIQGNSYVANNTITFNSAYAHYSAGSEPFTFKALGGGIYTKCTMENNSFAFNKVTTSCEGCYDTSLCFQIREGAGVYIEGTPGAECNVYFGNAGANEWQGNCPVSNINTNPMFCDTATGDYTIFDLSPCAAENNACSTLIGAFGVGCSGIPSVNGFGVPDETLTNLLSHMPLFSWAYYCPIGSPEDSFEIAVGTNPDWTHAEMWNPEAFAGPDTFVTYAGLPLVDGSTYYLRLRVHNGLVWSEWYNTSFRMNSVPTVPVNKHPDVLEPMNTTTPTLWVLNSTDPDGDPLFYDFEVLDFSENVVASASGIPQQADTTGWTVDVPLVENGFYYWQARAFDGYEYSEWSFGTLFLINATEEFPSAFLVYYPPDTDNTQVYDKPVEFIWGTSTDPDPIDTVTYRLIIAIDSNFTFAASHCCMYSPSFMVGDLNYSTHYWWKVEAIDTKGNMTPSTNTAEFWTWVLGDINGDRKITVGDAVFLVSYIFRGGPPPIRLKAADANGDCKITVGDAVYVISYIFREGPPPKVGCAK